jgi:hypothetical protein
MKKMFNEGNQIHNFMSCSSSGTVINYGSYGSGSTTLPEMPEARQEGEELLVEGRLFDLRGFQLPREEP